MERLVMRNVWWPSRLKPRQAVEFQNKTYRVFSQSETAQDSANFKSRFYTTLIETETFCPYCENASQNKTMCCSETSAHFQTRDKTVSE